MAKSLGDLYLHDYRPNGGANLCVLESTSRIWYGRPNPCPPQTSVNYLKVSVVISLGFRGIGKEMGKSSPDAVPTIAERGSAEVPTLIPAESGLRKPTLSLKRKG
jgi:hypothetical protein